MKKGPTRSQGDLYEAYEKWCRDNLEAPLSTKTFATQLMRDQERLKLRYDKNLDATGGKRARGYHGVHVMVSHSGC